MVSESDGFEEATVCIEGLNFRVQSDPPWLTSGRLLAKPRAGETTHHVFLFVVGDPLAKRMINLRDTLRQNPELAVRFEETKVHHWKCNEGDAAGYAESKRPFFEATKDI
jgi:GrpB-like predicted nucleotidyltransferase (UPF0157 family)